MKLNKWLLLILLFTSCAQVETINLQKHNLGVRPQKIVWIQVAGLSEEHLALIRFQSESIEKKTSFEHSTCFGKAWDYNLYDIRPTSQHGFLSQMTGKMNITGTCEDYQLTPVWAVLKKAGYQSYVLESENTEAEQSIIPNATCTLGQKSFVEDLILMKMAPVQPDSGSNLFHFQDPEQSFENGKTYFDKSCQSGACFASTSRNVDMIYSYISQLRGNSLLLIRDFSYQSALKANRIDLATEKLVEIEKIYLKFLEVADSEKDVLVLLTSSAPNMLELPARGTEWEQFVKNGKNVHWRHSSLVSPVFAYGAGSENFCGIYDASDIFKRILWTPGIGRFRFDFFNWF